MQLWISTEPGFPPGTHGKGQSLCPMHEMSLRFATLLQSLLRGAWVRPLKPTTNSFCYFSKPHLASFVILFLYRCQLDKSNPTTVELGAVALEYGPRCQLFSSFVLLNLYILFLIPATSSVSIYCLSVFGNAKMIKTKQVVPN